MLANTLTSASPDNLGQPVDLIRVGTSIDLNLIPESIQDQYIKWSDSEIDGALSQLYAIPFERVSDFEGQLLVDVNDYNNYIIMDGPAPFYVNDIIVLTEFNPGTRETVTDTYTIEELLNEDEQNIFQTAEPIDYEYKANCTRVLRLQYPAPIGLISTRLAAAHVYEKYFMAEASPSQSEYGKWQRELARADINNILNGITILHGAVRIGNRFVSPYLKTPYRHQGNKGPNIMESAS